MVVTTEKATTGEVATEIATAWGSDGGDDRGGGVGGGNDGGGNNGEVKRRRWRSSDGETTVGVTEATTAEVAMEATTEGSDRWR